MLCRDLWLGLEAKPLVAEREAATLEGDVRELVGEERPLPAWERNRNPTPWSEKLQPRGGGGAQESCRGGEGGGREGQGSPSQ